MAEPNGGGRRGWAYSAGLWVMGVLYVVAGINHFWHPAMYLAIMPPYIPWPAAMVEITGVAEILGGIGVLVPDGFAADWPIFGAVFGGRTRVFAAWGIVALLLAIWPVHWNMCLHPALYPGVPVWASWVRLPLQIPLIVWAWFYTRM